MASEIEHHRAQAQRRDQLKRVALKAIKDTRQDLRLTHKQVANGLGLKRWQVINMERGRRAVHPWDLALLEETYGLGPGELLRDIRRRDRRYKAKKIRAKIRE